MIAHTAMNAAGLSPLERTARIGKALADPGRLRILAAVRSRELCVCHLVDLLSLDASTVSRHVRVLRDAGLIDVRKEGRWLHCRRAAPRAAIWRAVDGLLAEDPSLFADQAALDADDCC